jgi:hypothetical protein
MSRYPELSIKMKSLFALLPILPLTFAATNQVTTALTLDPDVPIYLGHVFLAPTMTFIAWIPSENKYLNEWCYKATDVSKDALFTLGGVDALQVQEYFSNQAYITREGNRFADCSITPESGKIGKCESVRDGDREGGQKFTGPGVRKWSCWLIDDERRRINAT